MERIYTMLRYIQCLWLLYSLINRHWDQYITIHPCPLLWNTRMYWSCYFTPEQLEVSKKYNMVCLQNRAPGMLFCWPCDIGSWSTEVGYRQVSVEQSWVTQFSISLLFFFGCHSVFSDWVKLTSVKRSAWKHTSTIKWCFLRCSHHKFHMHVKVKSVFI